jgi:hypothetical protein
MAAEPEPEQQVALHRGVVARRFGHGDGA